MRHVSCALALAGVIVGCGSHSSTAPNTATGCAPDIPIPSATGRGWPSSCTSGASSTLGALTDTAGDIALSTQGQAYSNMRIDGSLTVLACDITIHNVEVDAGVPYTGNNTPDVFPIWLEQPANCSVTLDHVSVITKSAPNVYVTNAIRVAYGGPATITYAKIIGTQLGVTIGPGTITDSYIGCQRAHDRAQHVLEFEQFGANSHFVIDGNLLAGGGYTCYCADGVSDDMGNAARASDIVVTNNVFWEKYYSTVGYYGPGRAYNSAGGGQWTNNLFMGADGTLTSTSVPEPPIDQ
jgi:hypothetical protein